MFCFIFYFFQKIHIFRGDAKEPNKQFFPTDRSYIRIELNITPETVITSYGKPPKVEDTAEIETVNFETIVDATGRVGEYFFYAKKLIVS